MTDEESRVVAIVEAAFEEACAKAPGLIVCGPGCSDCCHRPFAITTRDAERLREGLAALPGAKAEAIRERAREVWNAMMVDFPGDADTGRLDGSGEWRDWFFSRHAGRPCPALDPRDGSCQLHSHRPVACRLYGPLIQIGDSRSEPCPKNYAGLVADDIEAMAVTVPAFEAAAESDETVAAFALL